ncbi:MAG TPA: Sec-independent protein translocase subunit TatA [Thermopolyspora sp.]|jgi:twin arginine-targeting protein translocase, TatA/E family
MPSLGPMEWILIILVLILLFGAKKLPDTAKALGQSLRMFKKETSKLDEEDNAPRPQPAQAVQTPPLPPAPPQMTDEERARALEEEAARLRAKSTAKEQQLG